LSPNHPLTPFCWYKLLTPTIGMLSIERTSGDIGIQDIIMFINKLNDMNIKKLILCFSYAFLPPPINVYGQLYTQLKGIGKFMNQNHLITLLTFLFQWMGDERQIVILSGDLHLGIHGQYKQNNKTIPLLISSPITNHPSLDRTLIAKGFKNETILLNEIIKLTIKSAKAKRCYGVVDLNDFTTSIEYSRDTYPKHFLNYIHTMLQF
jgi:hypothetical protein